MADDRGGARLPYLNADDVAEEDRDLLARNINLARELVHSPKALRNFSRLGMWIRRESTLDARLRELAILQVGYLTGWLGKSKGTYKQWRPYDGYY